MVRFISMNSQQLLKDLIHCEGKYWISSPELIFKENSIMGFVQTADADSSRGWQRSRRRNAIDYRPATIRNRDPAIWGFSTAVRNRAYQTQMWQYGLDSRIYSYDSNMRWKRILIRHPQNHHYHHHLHQKQIVLFELQLHIQYFTWYAWNPS